jgi:hypothetical protein
MAKSREEIDHYVLDQYEQEKHLGLGHERTKNLGHDWRESQIEQNPARPLDYEGGPVRHIVDEARGQGVYGKFKDPQSGISTADNLQAWSEYSTSNSYQGRDPKGRGAGSDNHLASPKEWSRFEYGSESGEGRLQKSGKR